MAENNRLPHIKVNGYAKAENYTSPKRGDTPPIKVRNRKVHGNKILQHLEKIKSEFEALGDKELPEGIVRNDAVYVEFISDYDFEPAFDSMHSDANDPKFQLLNVKEERISTNGVEKVRYRVNAMLTEGGISHFIKKVTQYLNENTSKGQEKQTPKNNRLISNLEVIQLATLESFWSEAKELAFPNENEIVWWEVWFRKKSNVDQEAERNTIIKQLQVIKAQISEQELQFPEHYIRLVKASARQLSNSLMLLDNLAELRKPKETADFFANLTISEKEDAIQELKNRTDNGTNKGSIAVCLLDSGVQNQHPLLSDFLPEENMYSYKPDDWGTHDGWDNGGHGTGMAGLVLYGDLNEALSNPNRIQIYHRLESVKIINKEDPNDPELYGYVTEEAANRPVIDAPDRPRLFCMAVADKDQAFYGRPSSWSAAVDKIAFGNQENSLDKQLFFVCGGNVLIQKATEYPDKNHYESVHDPGQAFNAITVGAYTQMDRIDIGKTPGKTPLAPTGGMAPANSTSIMWENDWPLKPDIVMEGGNLARNGTTIEHLESLKLLTTNKNFRTTHFQTFGDTSGATALASRFAAEVKVQYPELWPETIRGLMIHSADWNQTMLGGKTFESLNKQEKKNILRSFGYGVPNIDKALYSVQNSLTLIAEDTIQPFKKDGNIKYNEINLYELPWPREVLQDYLSDTDVKLNITLSYFIEPNPGNRRYGNKFSYQSHGLRFNVISPGEDQETFRKRVNKDAREDGEIGFTGESWIIGSQHRNKGSVHRDYWIGSGADLATRNLIAVYPVYGWYQKRNKLEKYNSIVRYSLIISIETPETEIDIYTPVTNLIRIEL